MNNNQNLIAGIHYFNSESVFENAGLQDKACYLFDKELIDYLYMNTNSFKFKTCKFKKFKGIEDIINKTSKLINYQIEFDFIDSESSFYHPSENKIYIANKHISNEYITIHELAHFLSNYHYPEHLRGGFNSHGTNFLKELRFLLSTFNILKKEDFDKLYYKCKLKHKFLADIQNPNVFYFSPHNKVFN